MKNEKIKKCSIIFAGGKFSCKEKTLPLLNKILKNFTNSGNNSNNSNISNNFCNENIVLIAADSGLVCADNYGLNCQYFLGDMDSVPDNLKKKYSDLQTFTFPKDKDFSDTELAFFKAEELKSEVFILLGGSGGRMDHFLSLFALFAQKTYPFFWFTEENIFICLDSDKNREIFVNGLSENDAVSVFAIIVPPFYKNCQNTKPVCKSKNLVWQLDNLEWDKGFYSLSNRIKNESDALQLSALCGRFVLVLPLKEELDFKFG